MELNHRSVPQQLLIDQPRHALGFQLITAVFPLQTRQGVRRLEPGGYPQDTHNNARADQRRHTRPRHTFCWALSTLFAGTLSSWAMATSESLTTVTDTYPSFGVAVARE